MLSKRNVILLLLPYIQKVLIFHVIFLKSNCFQRNIGVNFIVELNFNLPITRLMSTVQRKLLIMIFLIHQALVMIESTHVVGFLNWKSVLFIITVVQMTYGPTDNSYLSLRQPSVMFVIKIVLLQQILFYIKSVCIYVFHCLLVLFVILPILLILVYGCTLLNLMEV